MSKPAEGVLKPIVHVPHNDIKQHWSQYQPLRKTSVKCHMFMLIKTCWVSESNQTASG